MKKQILLLSVLAITITGCNSTQTTSSSKQNDMSTIETASESTWQLITLDGNLVDQRGMDQKIHFTLNPTTNKVSGFSGCNKFSGDYTVENGNSISFNYLASTRKACLEGAINENDVLDVFNLADSYTLQGDNLIIKKGWRSPLATFKKVSK